MKYNGIRFLQSSENDYLGLTGKVVYEAEYTENAERETFAAMGSLVRQYVYKDTTKTMSFKLDRKKLLLG